MSTETDLVTTIDEIRRLDDLRGQAHEIWERGLAGLTIAKYPRHPPDPRHRTEKHWVDRKGDLVECAALVFAHKGTATGAPSKVLQRLRNARVTGIFVDDEPFGSSDHVPVLRAASVLYALANVPGSALCETALACYFRILHELNSASSPSDMIGGASAGSPGARQNAFIASWCVRAVLALADAFTNTATLIGNLDRADEDATDIHPLWYTAHKATNELSSHATLAAFQGPALVPAATTDTATSVTSRVLALLRRNALDARTVARFARDRSWTNAFAVEQARRTFRCFALTDGIKPRRPSRSAVHEYLMATSAAIRESLEPSKKYLRAVLDHELATNWTQPHRILDAAEMVFAGYALKSLGEDDGHSLGRALDVVKDLLTTHGRLPSHRPFDIYEKGYVLHVATTEVTHALVQLCSATNFSIDSGMVEKLLRHFRDTWQGQPGAQGWRHERDESTGKCLWWLSALSVATLGSIGAMLDQRINQLILQDLTFRDPDALPLHLDDLFYPDYGLSSLNVRDESVAHTLQRMRAHVLGVNIDSSSVRSVILHGPPGTGKTTLVEALAKSAGVPLVEITPSDILVGGMEKFETRARLVFEALSMLTNVVILFDEFDSVLWDRAARTDNSSILQFVTPGMLPKLKGLNEAAKSHRMAFVLSTNLIGGLDPAVIREGRFDRKIGIYPPDLISRIGRLQHQSPKNKRARADVRARLLKVVQDSAGCGMNRLGQPGWFTKKKDPGDAEPMGYILRRGLARADVPWPPTETEVHPDVLADYPELRRLRQTGAENLVNEPLATQWKEWWFVAKLDSFARAHSVQEALDKVTGARDLKAKCREDCVEWERFCELLLPGI